MKFLRLIKLAYIRVTLITLAVMSTGVGFYFLYFGIQFYNDTKKYDLLNLSYLGQYVSGLVLSFFTLSTFILIVLAYLNQREEIRHLKEMNDKQESLIASQVAKDNYEKFERTFYRLLDWYNSFRNSISYLEPQLTGHRTYVGRGALNKVIDEYRRNRSLKMIEKKDLNSAIDTSFELMLMIHDDMQPYFNNLYSVLDFVDSYFLAEVIEEGEADKFIFVLNGQLARAEIELLFYYGLYSKAPKNLKQMIQNYGLLKNIDKNRFTDDEVKMYESSAYI